jgi:tellurite resistance protein TehA-like permease
MLENFTTWFAICIGSEGLGTVLNSPFPYPARWLEICGSISYVVDLAVFILYSAIVIARWILYLYVVVQKLMSTPEELNAYGIWPISLLTISFLTTFEVSTA